MRDTFTTLQAQAHNYTQTKTVDTAVNTFLKSEINKAYRFILATLINYKTQITYTATTVSNQQYYNNPAGNVMIESVVITIGSLRIPLNVLDSQKRWDDLNSVQFTGIGFPRFFFPRRDDFGIYPKPQGAYSMDVVYSPRYPDMQFADYTTGTVTAVNGSVNITGSGVTWTAAMIGRWISVTSDGKWYRIATVPTSDTLTIENYYEGVSTTGEAYTIGQSPELPEEIHELLAYRAAELFFIGMRKDTEAAKYWGNMFWTGDGNISERDLDDVRGGLLGAINRYSARNDSGVVDRRMSRFTDDYNKVWGTTIV